MSERGERKDLDELAARVAAADRSSAEQPTHWGPDRKELDEAAGLRARASDPEGPAEESAEVAHARPDARGVSAVPPEELTGGE